MIKLVKIINELTSMSYKVEIGRFTLDLQNKDNSVKPILNSTLLLNEDKFFIDRIHQDIFNKHFIFYEDINILYHEGEIVLEKLKEKYRSKGWKWEEAKT